MRSVLIEPGSRPVALRLTVYLRERGSDVPGVTRSDEPGDFLTIAEKNERRPQLHRERASEAASTAVFNLDMPHSRMVGERRCDDRLRGAAMAAPRSSKFDDGRPFQGIDVSSGDGLVSHVTSVVAVQLPGRDHGVAPACM